MTTVCTDGKVWWVAKYEDGVIINGRGVTQYDVIVESSTITRVVPS